MRIPNRGSPLKSSIYHFLIFVSFSSHIFFHTLTLLLKSYLREKEKKIIIYLFTSIILDQSHHMCFTRAMRLSYFSGPVLQQKKKFVFLFYIYNFYFENLIYKWIKNFDNLQESGPIFLAIFQWKLKLYFYRIVF